MRWFIHFSLVSSHKIHPNSLPHRNTNGNDMNMNDWIVVTVKNTNDDFSEIEPLNPNNKNDAIEGKFIKFLK